MSVSEATNKLNEITMIHTPKMSTGHTVPFQIYFFIAKCIGITPRGKQEDGVCKVAFSNFFSILWVFVFIYSTGVQFRQTGDDLNSNKKETGLALLLNCIKEVMGTAFVVLLFVYGYLLWDTWNIIPSAVLPAGNSEISRFYQKFSKVTSILQILAAHFILLVCKLGETYGLYLEGMEMFSFYHTVIADCMETYTQFVLVAMVWEISNILDIRYDYLKSEIGNVFSSDSMYIVNERRLKLKIKQIKSKYEALHTSMLKVNKVFGKAISVLIIYTVLTALDCVYWGLDNSPVLAGMLVGCFYHMVQLTVLIMACDRIEHCGLNIVESCYRLQGKNRIPWVSAELTHLTTYLEKLAPKFTLAGCLLVNRNTLSSLISVITSYVIIIIQMR